MFSFVWIFLWPVRAILANMHVEASGLQKNFLGEDDNKLPEFSSPHPQLFFYLTAVTSCPAPSAVCACVLVTVFSLQLCLHAEDSTTCANFIKKR